MCDVYSDVLVETFEDGFACADVLNEDGTVDEGKSAVSVVGNSPLLKLAGVDQSTSLRQTDETDRQRAQSLLDLIKSKHEIAELSIQTILKMVFVDNFVHGDMHPGNMLI